MKLLSKFLIYFVPVLLAALAAIIYYSNLGTYRILVREVEGQALARSKETVGLLSGAVRAAKENRILPHLQSLNEQAGGLYAMVLDQSGIVLAHTNVVEKGKTYNDALAAKSQVSGAPETAVLKQGDNVVMEIAEPIWDTAGDNEDFLFSGGTPLPQRRLGTLKLVLPLNNTLRMQSRLFFNQLVLMSIALGVVTLIMGLFFIRNVLRPIRHLVDATAQISGGNYNVNIPMFSRDEFGEFTERFNQMSRVLNETTVSMDRLTDEMEERKKAEHTLRESELRFRDIAFNMADWIWETDENGRYTYCSEKIVDILGYTADEVIGKTPLDLMPPEEAARIGKEFQKIAANKLAIRDMENWNLTKDGKLVCFLTSGVPILDDQWNLKGYRGVDKNITALKESEKEKEKFQVQLVQSEKLSAVGQLAAGVAHEINNPLGIILGFTQSIVRRMKDADPLFMPLKTIEREAVRCKNLVQNLLVFSRKGALKNEQFDMDPAVAEALSLVQAQTRVRSVELAQDLKYGGRILGDKNHLQQIVVNLCNNALDAMKEGGKLTVRTFARVDAGNPRAVLEVEDTGSGIPESIRKRIFEPFFTTKEPGKGTGLGLALVYEIVTKHGGAIDVRSELGKGTVFAVNVPSAQPASAPAQA